MRFFSATQAFYQLLSATILVGLAAPSWSAEGATEKNGSVSTEQNAATASPGARASSEAKPAAKVSVLSPSPEAQALIGRAYGDMRASNWPFAVAELCAALRYDRNSVTARRYLCYSLLHTGNAQDALSQLNSLATLNQSIPFDECMRGEALTMIGESDKGLEALKNALSMDPSSDYIRNELVEMLQSYARYQEAAGYCAEGYFGAKSVPMKQRYLLLYNNLQQLRALLAQRTLGVQIATTSSFPMKVPPPRVKPGVADKTDAKKAATASEATDTDEDTSSAPSPPSTSSTTAPTAAKSN